MIRSLLAYLFPPSGSWLVPIFYLQIIFLAEILTTLNEEDPRIGLYMHAVILLLLLFHGAMNTNIQKRRFLLALALAPLIRIISLSLPLTGRPLLEWYMFIGALVYIASFFTAKVTDLPAKRIGLTFGKWPMQIAFGLMGFFLGYLEYLILYPDPLAEAFTLEALLFPAFVLVVFTGLLEEIVFRGIIQQASLGSLGHFGITYVAILFAILHIGYQSILDVFFVFGVGLIFGVVAYKTGSLLGVSIAHGTTNISLFLIFPFLIGAPVQPGVVPIDQPPPAVFETPTATSTGIEIRPPTVTPQQPTSIPEALPTTPAPFDTPEGLMQICNPPPGWVLYQVQSGDSMIGLSAAHGISVAELRASNCLQGETITVGQAVFVPERASAFLDLSLTPTPTPAADP